MPPRKSDPQAVAIVDAYLKALGGKDVLSAIQDRTTKFMNIKSQATGDTKVEINLYMKKMADYALGIREEWDVKDFDIQGMPLAFTQIYNGKINEGWVLMLETVSSLDGKTLQVFVWDKFIDDFFMNWEDNGYTLTLAGQGLVSAEILGKEVACDIVLATDFSGRQTTRYYFSKDSGLLVKKEWQDASTSPRGTVKKEQYYKEYRELGFLDNSGHSLKFALRLEIYMDGDLDTVRRYTNVLFNSGLSDKLFEKPEGKPFEKAFPGGKRAEDQETTEEEVPDRTVRPMHGRKRPSIRKVTPITPVPEGDEPEAEGEGTEEPEEAEAPDESGEESADSESSDS